MEGLICKRVRLNQIKKDIAWINSEYTKMFPTDPNDIDMIADNERVQCAVLHNLLASLKEEIKESNYELTANDKVIISKLSIKLAKLSAENMEILSQAEERVFKSL